MRLCRCVILLLVAVMLSNFLIVGGTDGNCEEYSEYYSNGNHCVDYRWCMYKFYTMNKTWFEAKAICEKENMTLAHIKEASQHRYLYDLMKNTLTSMFASPPSAVWLGGYHYSGMTLWQDDCRTVDNTYVDDVSMEACFLLDDISKFKTESCMSPQPFLCQESTLDFQTCFVSSSQIHGSKANGGFAVSDDQECFHKCVLNTHNCVGIELKSTDTCALFTYYTSGKPYIKGSVGYVRDMIRTTVPSVVTAGISDLQQVCPSSVAVPSHEITSITLTEAPSITPTRISSITPTEISSITPTNIPIITPTKTFSGTTATVASTSTSTLIVPSYLEPSSPESVPAEKASSESTPPLPSVITSVSLEKTSLPTVSETVSASCTECPCIQSTSVIQAEMEESIRKLKEQLRVNPKKLSLYKRKLTSASDDRQSAANIGYVAALILCVIPGLVILLDMGRLTREFKQFISRLRDSGQDDLNTPDKQNKNQAESQHSRKALIQSSGPEHSRQIELQSSGPEHSRQAELQSSEPEHSRQIELRSSEPEHSRQTELQSSGPEHSRSALYQKRRPANSRQTEL